MSLADVNVTGDGGFRPHYSSDEGLTTEEALDIGFLLTCAIFTMSFQGGFALLESGSVSPLHTVHVALKNMADFGVGCVAYVICGYAFAWGAGNSFGGASFFMTAGVQGKAFADWVFQLSFSATAATIVSGGTAGRMRFGVYVVLSGFITALVYPFAARWTWHPDGFLNVMGFTDFAGGGCVHILGGVCALVCTVYLKPRLGIFLEDGSRSREGSNPVLVLLGCFLLWVGWYGFNGGSAGGLSRGRALVAARAATNTAAASGAGCITALAFSYLNVGATADGKTRGFDLFAAVTGLLSALVGITPSCGFVEPWAALLIGTVASITGVLVSSAVERLMIDDPVDAFAVHGAAGVVGILLTGVFADTTIGKDPGFEPAAQGLVHGGGLRLVGIQALGATIMAAWAALWVGLFLVVGGRILPLRTSKREELTGANSGLDLMVTCPDQIRAEIAEHMHEFEDAGGMSLPAHLRNRKILPGHHHGHHGSHSQGHSHGHGHGHSHGHSHSSHRQRAERAVPARATAAAASTDGQEERAAAPDLREASNLVTILSEGGEESNARPAASGGTRGSGDAVARVVGDVEEPLLEDPVAMAVESAEHDSPRAAESVREASSRAGRVREMAEGFG